MAKEPARILVTGAAGQIGYALVPMIARGIMLGADQPVILHLLDIPPAAEALNGVKMELVDAAFPLLKGVVATTDVVEACNGVNIAVMVGGFPRKEGMERKDVMTKNVSIYRSQASAHDKQLTLNLDLVEEHRNQAHLRNVAYKQRISNYYDSRVKPRSFKVGDWVLKKRLLCDRVPSEGTLSPNWDGPFEVVGISRPGSYKLRNSDGKTLGHPWNADHLKYYYK